VKEGEYHGIHCFFRLMDYNSPSLRVYDIEISVCDYAEDFDDGVGIRIEACHLGVLVPVEYQGVCVC